MRYEVRWRLLSRHDGHLTGKDIMEFNHDPTKDEIIEIMSDISWTDGTVSCEQKARETMPNFYWAHVGSTKPLNWKVTSILAVGNEALGEKKIE